jgi:hypothetical protein
MTASHPAGYYGLLLFQSRLRRRSIIGLLRRVGVLSVWELKQRITHSYSLVEHGRELSRWSVLYLPHLVPGLKVTYSKKDILRWIITCVWSAYEIPVALDRLISLVAGRWSQIADVYDGRCRTPFRFGRRAFALSLSTFSTLSVSSP